MNMKLTAGLGRLEDYPALVEAGADEVYCGCVPYDWLKKYGAFFALNRREVLYYAVQIGSLDEMRLLARQREALGVPVALTFNSPFYPPEQYPAIIDLMRRLIDIGFDRMIVADPALLLRIRQEKLSCRIHLSGEAGDLNLPAMRFFDELHPIERFIFHRKLTVQEMRCLIMSFPERQYEAFLLNEQCHFTGAHCASIHCDELPPLCRVPYHLAPRREGGQLPSLPEAEAREASGCLGESGCGLCALPALARAGVTHLKIVGRGNQLEHTVRDLRAARLALRLARQAPDDRQFQQALLDTLFPSGCCDSCYYRERREVLPGRPLF